MALDQLRNRLLQVLPEGEIPVFLDALQELSLRPRKSIRFNRSREDAIGVWRSLGLPLLEPVSWCENGWFIPAEVIDSPEVILFQAAGLGYIQEASAMEVAPALEIQSGNVVLDLCAAPGGKSTQLGELLGNTGWVMANEVDRERVRSLDALLLRQGVSRSTVFSLFPEHLAERYPARFSRILVDAPCSSESFFAKRAEKRTDVTNSEVRRCAKKQLRILQAAAAMAAGDARLVYSTCTYSREENEEVVAGFLEEYPEWRLRREVRRFPHRDSTRGCFAVLQRAEGERAGLVQPEEWQLPPRMRTSQGVVRNGTLRWDGSTDAYAEWMASGAERLPSDRELTTEEAIRFCRGETSGISGGSGDAFRVLWKGFPIGGFRYEGGKSQQALPRTLLLRSARSEK